MTAAIVGHEADDEASTAAGIGLRNRGQHWGGGGTIFLWARDELRESVIRRWRQWMEGRRCTPSTCDA